jgi:hypothetical protein
MFTRLAVLGSLVAALCVPAAPALGRGAPHADSSITLNQAGTSVAQSAPHLGGTVSFTAVYPGNVKTPRVEVLCYQNGALVYGEAGAPTDTFLLGGNPDGGSIWRTTLGPASCVANLYYFTWKAGEPAAVYLATTSFDAAG